MLGNPHASFDFQGTERFEVIRRLGAGGMGVVYEVFDRAQEARVALKTLHNVDAQSLYRLKKEFRTLQDLEHANLVSLGELIQSGHAWFFTMELVEGVDFLSYVRPDQVLDERRLRDALRQLALGLSALHRAGTVHRDIKPSNILVSSSGRVVLLDFGLSTEVDLERQSADGSAVGTAEYMAPEQAASKAVGPEVDWYGAGVLLYQALTGRLPFTGSVLEILMDKQQHVPAPPRSHVPNLPDDLESLCCELLKYDPRERPPERSIMQRLGATEAEARAALAAPHLSMNAPFIGRTHEAKALAEALAEVRGGGGAAMLVHGASGLGKSALVRKFADEAATSDPAVVVLSGRCYEREALPYKAFDGVIDALSKHLRTLDDSRVAAVMPAEIALARRMFPVLGRVEAIARARTGLEVGGSQELRGRIFAAVRRLMSNLGTVSLLMIVIDDVQWADADSLALLRELLRPPDPPRLLLVLTARIDEGHTLEQVRGRLARVLPPPVRELEVRALVPQSALELARALLLRSGISSDSDAAAIAREAEGHPLFIAELVHRVASTGDGTAPVRLDEAIWSRVQGLPPSAKLILESISVAGAPLSQEVLRRATKLPPQDFQKGLSLLRVAHLVRMRAYGSGNAVEPYHDRVLEAVISHLDDRQRCARHEMLAAALEVEDQRPELLVRHLEAAGQRLKAADYAERAAAHAARALAFDRAAQLYRTALRLSEPQGPALRALQLALGDALLNAARGPEAADCFLAAAEGAEPTTRMECRRLAAEQLMISGHIERGLDTMDSLLVEMGVYLPKTAGRAFTSLLWNRLKLRLRGLKFKPRLESQVAREELMRVDVLKSISQGLSMVDSIRGSDFNTRDLLWALRTGEVKRVARALALEFGHMAAQGQFRRARRIARVAERLSDENHDPYIRAWTDACWGALHYFEGSFGEAVRTFDRSLSLLSSETRGAPWEIGQVRMFRLFALRRMGSMRELGATFEQMVRDAAQRGDRYTETTIRRYCSELWLARDEAAAAHLNLAQADWLPLEGHFHVQHWFELEARGELALYEDLAVGALEALSTGSKAMGSSLLMRVKMPRTLHHWLQARLRLAAAAAGHEPSTMRREVTKSIRLLAREKESYARVWRGLLEAALAHQEGDASRACDRLRQAMELAESREMHLAADLARLRLAGIVGGDEGEELRAAALRRLAVEGVAAPDRMLRVIVPGF